MTTLQDYLNAARRLLHDANGRYWSDADLTISINDARRRVVADTTCYRQLQTVYLSPSLERYQRGGVSGALVTAAGSGYTSASTITFSASPTGDTATGALLLSGDTVAGVTITSTGSGYTTAPTVTFGGPGSGAALTPSIINPSTLDVMSITVIWGQTRVVLQRMSWTEFQASMRAWVGYQQRPGICASYGQDQWFIGPIPDQFYVSEWDTVLVPADLALASGTCVIAYPYTDAVPFYAAHLSKLNEQSYDEADRYLQLYTRKLQQAIRSASLRMLKSPYGS